MPPALTAPPPAIWQPARTADREAIRLHAQLAHQGDVVAPAMVVVAGDIAIVAVMDLPPRVAEAIPDRLALAILVPCAFDLVRGGGRAPDEAVWECHLRHMCSLLDRTYAAPHSNAFTQRVPACGSMVLLYFSVFRFFALRAKKRKTKGGKVPLRMTIFEHLVSSVTRGI